MIPRRLQLHNFLSYRDCTVDFSPLHLAAVSGPNGHGKSALLDGMTWALWGRCRAGTDDDAIRMGSREMFVDFEFELETARFAVNRKKTRGKTGQLQLFQIGTDGSRTPLTGSVMRETQRDINRRVLLDYDTFRNSVFIAQGHADEFTRKPAAERKKVLRNVLGLERYEEYAQRARGLGREREGELRALRVRMADAAAALEELPALRERISDLEAEQRRTDAAAVEASASVDSLQVAAREFEQREGAVEEARKSVAEAEQQLSRAGDAATRARDQFCSLEAALKDERSTTDRYSELKALRLEENELAGKQKRVGEATAAIADARILIAREQAAIETEIEGREQTAKDHESLAAELPSLEESEGALREERTRLEQVETEIQRLREAAAQCRQTAAAGRQAAGSAKERAEDIKEREAQLVGVARCPVCQSPLAPQEADAVRAEYAAERRRLGEIYSEGLATAERSESEADHYETEAKRRQEEQRTAEQQLRRREQETNSRLERSRAGAVALPGIHEAVLGLRRRLVAGDFAKTARGKVAALEETIRTTGYDRERHDFVRERMDELAPAETQLRKLEAARSTIGQARELVTITGDAVVEREEQLRAAKERLEEAVELLAVATDVSEPLDEARKRLGSLNDAIRELTFRRGKAEQRKAGLQELEASLEEQRDREKALADESGVYGDLAAGFGRDGVQAMLIDQALPRMEAIANDLLAAITGDRIQLQLATRRETKSGKVSETLDIRISDELGTRDYAMFSGGEAFRIDFALRIAMSQTLAERSGASLPTLIIDEGFGSQDREGLDRLVDVLTAIQDRFRLILVVTHLEELKQRFDRTIDVWKDEETGSVATVY